MAGQPLGERIVDVLQETRRVLDLSQAAFPADENGKLPGLKEAVGQFDGPNLARLALGQRPVTSGAEGLDASTGFVGAKNAWITEQRTMRDGQIATIARPAFIAAQNAILAELVEGEQFTVARLDGAGYDSMRTLPEEGLKRVEGPVTGTLSVPRAELGGFTLMPAEGGEPATKLGYFVNILDWSGETQLDLTVAEATVEA